LALRPLVDDRDSSEQLAEIKELLGRMRRDLAQDELGTAAMRFVEYWEGPGAFRRLSIVEQATLMGRAGLVASHLTALMTDTPPLPHSRSLRSGVLLMAAALQRTPMERITSLLRETLVNATFERLPALGHMGPLTHPRTVADRLAAFVNAHAFA